MTMPGLIQGAMMPRQEAPALQRRPNAPMQPGYPQMPGIVTTQGMPQQRPGMPQVAPRTPGIVQHQGMPAVPGVGGMQAPSQTRLQMRPQMAPDRRHAQAPQIPGVVQAQGQPRTPVDEVHARYQAQMRALKQQYDARMRQFGRGHR